MSSELWLEVDDDPDPRDAELLNEGLYRYNRAHTGFADGSSLGVFLRDREGIIVGGAYGYTWGGCLDVKYLWVEDQLRHSGYGTRLLRAAEQAAAARGCHTAMLDTYEFQAPEFYQKLGYEVYGVIDDPQVRCRKFFFKRALPRGVA
jgi:GNAT superfamily N-acetyltransferase